VRFENENIFLNLKKTTLAHYNSGVVHAAIIGLAPGTDVMIKKSFAENFGEKISVFCTNFY
jgi:hypothetical protein